MQKLMLKDVSYADENLKEILQLHGCEYFIKFDDEYYSGKSHFFAFLLGRFLRELTRLKPLMKDEIESEENTDNRFAKLVKKYNINSLEKFEKTLMKNGGDGALYNKANKAKNIIYSFNQCREKLKKIVENLDDPRFFEEELRDSSSCIIEVTQGTCKRPSFRSYALEPEIILLKYLPNEKYKKLGHTLLWVNFSLDPIMNKNKDVIFSFTEKKGNVPLIYSIFTNKREKNEGDTAHKNMQGAITKLGDYINDLQQLLVNLLHGQRFWKQKNLEKTVQIAQTVFEMISSGPELYPILFKSYKHQLLKFRKQLSQVVSQISQIQFSIKEDRMKQNICEDCIARIGYFVQKPYYRDVLCDKCHKTKKNLEDLANLLCENYQLYLDLLQNRKEENCIICGSKKYNIVFTCRGNHKICKKCSIFCSDEAESCPLIGCGKKRKIKDPPQVPPPVPPLVPPLVPPPVPPPNSSLDPPSSPSLNTHSITHTSEQYLKLQKHFKKAIINCYAKGYLKSEDKKRVLTIRERNEYFILLGFSPS